jgi:hypothetical protein
MIYAAANAKNSQVVRSFEIAVHGRTGDIVSALVESYRVCSISKLSWHA